MLTIKYDGPGYHVKIFTATPFRLSNPAWLAFIGQQEALDVAFDMVSLDVAASGPDYTYALVAEAGQRTYSATLRPTSHQRAVAGTSFWTLQELLIHNPVIEAVFGLLDLGVTKIKVDWS